MGFRFQNGLLGAVVYFAVPLAVGFGVAWFMVTVAMSADSASAVGSLNAVLLLLTFFPPVSSSSTICRAGPNRSPRRTRCPTSPRPCAATTTAGEPVFGFDAWVSVAWAVGLTVVFGFLATKAYSRSR